MGNDATFELEQQIAIVKSGTNKYVYSGKSSKTDNVLNTNRSLFICDGKVKKFKILHFIFVSSSPFHEKCMVRYEGLRSMNEFFSSAELIFSC